jgi:hypothetical protein
MSFHSIRLKFFPLRVKEIKQVFSTRTISPLFPYDGGEGDLGVMRGNRHYLNYSLEMVGEFYATDGEEGVGTEATPFGCGLLAVIFLIFIK